MLLIHSYYIIFVRSRWLIFLVSENEAEIGKLKNIIEKQQNTIETLNQNLKEYKEMFEEAAKGETELRN